MSQSISGAENKKRAPDLNGTPWKATVAPNRRNGKELEGEAQSQTDVAAELE